jgi:hypothetical protein
VIGASIEPLLITFQPGRWKTNADVGLASGPVITLWIGPGLVVVGIISLKTTRITCLNFEERTAAVQFKP